MDNKDKEERVAVWARVRPSTYARMHARGKKLVGATLDEWAENNPPTQGNREGLGWAAGVALRSLAGERVTPDERRQAAATLRNLVGITE